MSTPPPGEGYDLLVMDVVAATISSQLSPANRNGSIGDVGRLTCRSVSKCDEIRLWKSETRSDKLLADITTGEYMAGDDLDPAVNHTAANRPKSRQL